MQVQREDSPQELGGSPTDVPVTELTPNRLVHHAGPSTARDLLTSHRPPPLLPTEWTLEPSTQGVSDFTCIRMPDGRIVKVTASRLYSLRF